MYLQNQNAEIEELRKRNSPAKFCRKLKNGRDQRDQLLHFETESETGIFRVTILRPGPRLKFSESQFQDRVRDCKFPSLNFKTEFETQFFQVSVLRPSPRLKEPDMTFGSQVGRQ